jgi:CRP-like cAMP-binding protein
MAVALEKIRLAPLREKTPAPNANQLLAALPREVSDSLIARSELVRFPVNRILYEAGEAAHYAYFPQDGMVSLLAITEDGGTIEIATAGREGFIGVPVLHQVSVSPYRVTVQLPMSALRIRADEFLFEISRHPQLRSLLLSYAHLMDTQLTQAVICNLTHTVEQRLARRLLVMSDCLGADTFRVTQEQLGAVLARHRNRISIASLSLKELKLIEIARGELRIVDRGGLEKAACDCYRIIKDASRIGPL